MRSKVPPAAKYWIDFDPKSSRRAAAMTIVHFQNAFFRKLQWSRANAHTVASSSEPGGKRPKCAQSIVKAGKGGLETLIIKTMSVFPTSPKSGHFLAPFHVSIMR